MSGKPNPQVQPKPERRRLTAEYKQRIVAEAEQCKHGELGSLLRREGLTYAQINQWRKAQASGNLVDKTTRTRAESEACGNASAQSGK